jgi:hypothetical protein
MPWLNRVLEELGIHHEEYEIPPEVLASLEEKKKKKKNAAKNTTAAAKSKKRKGQMGPKALAKKLKVGSTSTALRASPTSSSVQASASAREGSMEDTSGDHAASTTEEVLKTLADGGDGGVDAREASIADPFPNVFGGDSGSEHSDATGVQSPARDVEVPTSSARRHVAEVSEDEGESPNAARVAASASFPLLYSKCTIFLIILACFFLLSVATLRICFLLFDCFCLPVGSVTNTLASKEELTAGASMGHAGMGMPPWPPVIEPPLRPGWPNLEAGTCEFFYVSC